MTEPRIRDAGDSALLLELEAVIDPLVNDRAISIAGIVREARHTGVRDVVSTYQSVAVHFDPLLADVTVLRRALADAARAPVVPVAGATIDVPVEYGGESGPDLAEVARLAGLGEPDVIRLHAEREYRVFMLGFLPGFPYLGVVDERIATPRRQSPRLFVPSGSVGIAGRQTGIYPRDSPGGWQIIGRTSLRLFDHRRSPAAMFSPGDRVRFVPVDTLSRVTQFVASNSARGSAGARTVTVLRPGLFTTVQDSGRWGHQASGVSVAGPLDEVAHRLANVAVGNDAGAATLEVTLLGPELRFDHAANVVLTGADLAATLDGSPVVLDAPFACGPGSILAFGARRRGARAYLGVDGGFVTPPVFGSRATHARSGIGGLKGRALAAGDRIELGDADMRRRPPARDLSRTGLSSARLPAARGAGARLRIMSGPYEDEHSADVLEALQHTRFVVGAQSDRMGYRLTGPPIVVGPPDEGISTATVPGAIQLPPSGEPILLMADRQTAGGYPQVATVITADQPLAGQLAPGDWVEFERCSRGEAIAALIALEGRFRAMG